MRVLGINNYNIDNNCRKSCFRANAVGKQITAAVKKKKLDKSMSKFRNYIFFSGVATTAMLASQTDYGKIAMNDNIERLKQLSEKMVYDSIAWNAFDNWYEANVPYWDEPDYDGPIIKEDFLKWQDEVNAWWKSYYSENG